MTSSMMRRTDTSKNFAAKFKKYHQAVANASSSLTVSMDAMLDYQATKDANDQEPQPLQTPARAEACKGRDGKSKTKPVTNSDKRNNAAQKWPQVGDRPHHQSDEEADGRPGDAAVAVALPDDDCQLMQDIAAAIESGEFMVACEDGPVILSKGAFFGSTDGLDMDFSSVRKGDENLVQTLVETVDAGKVDCKQRRSAGLPHFSEAWWAVNACVCARYMTSGIQGLVASPAVPRF